MEDLASIAQNKSLNNALSDATRNINPSIEPTPIVLPMENQNTINEISRANGTNNEVIQNPVGFMC